MVECSDCYAQMKWKSQIEVGNGFKMALVQCPKCKRIDIVSLEEGREGCCSLGKRTVVNQPTKDGKK